MNSPYQITRQFEEYLCEYTGAKYAVAVNSGTAALLLACQWHLEKDKGCSGVIEIPKHTYVSVPCAIMIAGGRVGFRDEKWSGEYSLSPYPVWDSARRFTSGMYRSCQFQCVSFSASKILAAEQGGAILHDNDEADAWFRRMRFDGRAEGVGQMEDTFELVGHHCLMLPSVAAHLVVKLYHLPRHNEDLPEIEYPDLSKCPAFA